MLWKGKDTVLQIGHSEKFSVASAAFPHTYTRTFSLIGPLKTTFIQVMYQLLRLKPSVISFLAFSLFSTFAFAQKSGLEVSRSSAIDRSSAVQHVAMDATGVRWVANDQGVFHLKGPDIATKKLLSEGTTTVAKFHGGNMDYVFSEAEFRKVTNTDSKITAAWYDERTKHLLIGTQEAGLFQLKTEPGLQLVEKYTTGNSKMKSNHVTVIFLDKSGRWWVGTVEGLMFGTPGKWKANLDNYEIRRVREYGTEMYLLGDGEIIRTVGGDKWTTIVLDESKVENEVMDFDIDKNGKMWVVSGVVTSYNMLDDKYQVFDGAENYASTTDILSW